MARFEEQARNNRFLNNMMVFEGKLNQGWEKEDFRGKTNVSLRDIFFYLHRL